MYSILQHINNKATDYFIIKQKIGHKYYNLKRYKNNVFNRTLLLIKRFNKNRELYLVPEFNDFEGYYYRI